MVKIEFRKDIQSIKEFMEIELPYTFNKNLDRAKKYLSK